MTALTIGRCVPASWRGQVEQIDERVNILPKVRDQLPRPRVSIPFKRLVVCLNDDCGHGFEIGGPCPACGGSTFAPIESFLKPRDTNDAPLPWKAPTLRGKS